MFGAGTTCVSRKRIGAAGRVEVKEADLLELHCESA